MKASNEDHKKIVDIIQTAFNKLSDKRKKFVINVPGIKGNINPTIQPVSEYDVWDSGTQIDNKIKTTFRFNYYGLGNHPSNNTLVDIYLYFYEGKIYMSNANKYGSFDSPIQLKKEQKKYIIDLIEGA